MSIELAHVTSPMPGEDANGDGVYIRHDNGNVLFAVIDGLGHGPIAARASRAAIMTLEAASLEHPVLATMHELHESLRHTRGAAATVCVIRGKNLEACAVGNVQLSCAPSSVPLVLSPGVLGHQVPKFRVCSCSLRPRTRLALTTDGISTRFRLDEFERMKPTDACKAIMMRHRKIEDDATILIADMDG